jgi:hypothetical protein
MRRIPIIAIYFISLLFTPALYAWNAPGHMTVALLAWRQLSDSQKQQIGELLKHHPHYQKYLLAKLPEGVNESEWAFMKAATWPDWVRPPFPGMIDPPQDPAVTRKYHQPSWHYITLFYVNPADIGKVKLTDLQPREEPNILTAIDQAMKELADSKTTDEQKAIELAWLLHLIGDLHQPLHTCSMVSLTYPQSDRGGNEQTLRAGSHVTRLHSFWDECLGTSEDYVALAFIADSIQHDPRLDPSRLPLVEHNTPESWMMESNADAVAFAYLGGRLPTTRTSDVEKTHKAKPEDVPPLPTAYEANAHDLCHQRAALAGYRLAAKLAEIFR